jgi:hypothetical protein
LIGLHHGGIVRHWFLHAERITTKCRQVLCDAHWYGTTCSSSQLELWFRQYGCCLDELGMMDELRTPDLVLDSHLHFDEHPQRLG